MGLPAVRLLTRGGQSRRVRSCLGGRPGPRGLLDRSRPYLVCGLKPTSAQRTIEEAITTVNRITDEVRPGRTPREVGVSVDATTDRSDLGIYGHGLSTFWLGPLIPAQPLRNTDPGDTLFDADEPFREGQIFTSETFISEPGVGTAGFEDVFIVREGGNELYDHTPQRFW